ncbi:MAG: HIT domain-containing protein [Bdellovibrionaceae bacterium]|nr:HIT domain-containing protein [Bdellovibrio sp.]
MAAVKQKKIVKAKKRAAPKKAKVLKKLVRQPSSVVDADGWPSPRNVFFRPERMKYVRKLVKVSGCVFCTAAKAKPSFESLCVFKSQHSQIILNKYPYNNGHLLVLPLNHLGNILDLSPERYDDLHQTLRIAMEAVQRLYAPAGFNVGLNHGASAGAGIPDHIHYHIVPRWGGDLNFFPLIANAKIVVETLETSYNRFLQYFDSLQRGQS